MATSRAKPISWVAEHHRQAAAGELADDAEDLADELGVERRGDLVEQQHLGVDHQGPHDGGALVLPAAHPVGVLVGLVAEPEPGEQLTATLLGLATWASCGPAAGPRVMLSSTVMCGNRLNDWNTMPMRRRISFWLTPRPVISSPSRRIEPGVDAVEQVDAAQQGGLAAPARADQADDLVFVDGEVDAVEHVLVAEGLVDAVDLELRGAGWSVHGDQTWV